MSSNRLNVSIGLPVFNGEKYLEQTINSILAQTYQDFELIISDNASTDHTPEICREYASKDCRIRYYRNQKNLGASKNYNRVFELSSGKYFKWAAYDDLLSPEYLNKCVEILDNDPSVVLCHSKTAIIDELGRLVGDCDHRTLSKIHSWKLHERFGDLISIRNSCWIIFGVVRADTLRKTPLHGSYVGADRNLLAEIGLMGRIYEIPEHLFFRRDHPEAYTRMFCEKKYAIDRDNYRAQSAWWSNEYLSNYPNWRDCFEFFRSVRRVRPSFFERLLCYGQIFSWFTKEGWRYMESDIENLLLRRSSLARKLIPTVKSNLGRALIPLVQKMRQ
ncbi:MAG: glycosyltransferase family 2 protein [Promethearchaeota archaeon]